MDIMTTEKSFWKTRLSEMIGTKLLNFLKEELSRIPIEWEEK